MRTILIVMVMMMTTSALSQSPGFGISDDETIPQGLQAGVLAPKFQGTDQNGEVIKLSELIKKGPVVIIFYRGYWCGVCNRHLAAFQSSLEAVTSKGATVVAVTPEANDGVEKTISKNDLEFSVISDGDYSIMDAYKVRFLVTEGYNRKIRTFKGIGIDENNGADKPYLPVPATYIVDTDGKIKKVFFDPNYKNRPTAEEIAQWL